MKIRHAFRFPYVPLHLRVPFRFVPVNRVRFRLWQASAALAGIVCFCGLSDAASPFNPASEERAYTLEAYIRLVDHIIQTNGKNLRHVKTIDHYVPLKVPGVEPREYLLKEVFVRPSYSIEIFLKTIQRDLFDAGFLPIERPAVRHPYEECREVTVYKDAFPLYILRLREKIAARVAFIIDDVGYNERALPYALVLRCPVTFAVLPGLAYSQKTAEKLLEHHFQIMLHLPLESGIRMSGQEKGTIRRGMAKEEIIARLTQALDRLPGIVGVNNHMGSRATKDETVMETVLAELKKRNLFFVDSVTTVGSSAVPAVSQRLGLVYKGRDVFLDNRHTQKYIRRQIEELKRVALHRREAIGIGHFYPITLKMIEEMRPVFEEADIKIVFVSELFQLSDDSLSKRAQPPE